MRKRTLTGVCVFLAIAVILGLRIVGLSIPFGLSPLVVGFVLVPILMVPLTFLNKPLLAWRKQRGRDIEDEERYEDDASGIISLRPRN